MLTSSSVFRAAGRDCFEVVSLGAVVIVNLR
jgi:hypothetical protein